MLIDFKELLPKHGINPTGIFQVGSSHGQEMQTYWDMGIKRMVMIEALPDVYDKLVVNARKFEPYVYTINACVSDVDDETVTFNVANNEGQSSSLFDFDTHTKEHPTVEFTDVILLKTKRLDRIIKDHRIAASDYDLLNIDLQGAELLALKSLGKELGNFNSAYIEVNEKHLYKDCPLVGDIDNYMAKFGFVGVETFMTPFGWGDKLYKKM